MNSVEKKLEEEIRKMSYSHFDVLDSLISYKTFIEPGFVKCPNAIDRFSDLLISCMSKSKHPTLNPTIDEIYEYKTEENTGKDAIKRYIEETGEFTTDKIDNSKNFLEITIPFKMMFVNVESFIESEEIEMKKASVQTALFKKEIG